MAHTDKRMGTMSKSKRKAKQRVSIVTTNQTLGSLVSKLWFYLVFLLIPLYMNKDMYTAMIQSKGKCFWFIGVICITGVVIYYIQGIISKEYKWKLSLNNWNFLDIGMLLFGVSVFISFLLSEDKLACLKGENGFYCGTFLCLISIILYFFLSRNLISDKQLWDMVIIVSDIIFVWIFLNSISIDILNMHAAIIEEQYFSYYASLGNSNSISAYLCLLIPVGLIFFLHAEKRADQWFYGSFAVLGVLAALSIHTEGVWIGLVIMMLFFLPYCFSSWIRLERLMLLGMAVGGMLVLLKLLSLLIPNKMYFGAGISTYLIRYWAGAFLLLICAFVYLFCKKRSGRMKEAVLKKISYVLDAVIVIGIAGYVISSIRSFDYTYGSGRGAIWMGSVQLFGEYSVTEKLFGLGTEMIKGRLTELVSAIHNTGQNFANCHNNILECLLTLGLFGLFAYLFVWVFVIKEYIDGSKKSLTKEQAAYFLALIAYFGQSIVGNPYSLSAPMVFVMLALLRNQSFSERRN